MNYSLGQIFPYDKTTQRQLDNLLRTEGILKDENLDYSCGIFDDGELIATGSCFGNTLRCLAVSSLHRGEGLMAAVITHLIEYEYCRGITHLFVYTKPEAAPLFKDLGFYEIISIPEQVSFLENTSAGFAAFCRSFKGTFGTQAAIVMNANPFTLGHLHLVSRAAAENDRVHVFVLSEDKSDFPSNIRYKLVAAGCAGIPNVILHETNDYMISQATFPGYFIKEPPKIIKAHALLDAKIFVKIAKETGITRRYLGSEIPESTTGIYNDVLKQALPEDGIELIEIPRLSFDGTPVSASSVRKLLAAGRMDEVKDLVPESTWEFLKSSEGAEIICHIREKAGSVL